MAKTCEQCGQDLNIRGHRANCPLRKKRVTNSKPTDDGLVINPAVQSDDSVVNLGEPTDPKPDDTEDFTDNRDHQR